MYRKSESSALLSLVVEISTEMCTCSWSMCTLQWTYQPDTIQNVSDLEMPAILLSGLQLCEKITAGAERHWIDEQSVPYAVLGDQWYGYDDGDSIEAKVQLSHDNLHSPKIKPWYLLRWYCIEYHGLSSVFNSLMILVYPSKHWIQPYVCIVWGFQVNSVTYPKISNSTCEHLVNISQMLSRFYMNNTVSSIWPATCHQPCFLLLGELHQKQQFWWLHALDTGLWWLHRKLLWWWRISSSH